ncbi:HEPN domain-containing protein [Candidatus Magnetomoraceae bacterium gMMP-15]
MKQSTTEWLKTAKEDIIVMESILKNEMTTCAASFHAQQSVEKSLKAIFEEYDTKILRTHNLDKLFSKIRPYLNIDFNESTVDKLNSLYIDSRYPGAFGFLPNGKPTLEDVDEFYVFAKFIFYVVKKFLEAH